MFEWAVMERRIAKNAAHLWYTPHRGGERGLLLQGQDTRWVLEKAPTVCGYLVGHSAEIFHLVTSHLVDDFLEPEDIGLFFFIGLTLSDGPHLDEDLVICQG